jgi:hypothetical protein
LPRDVGGCERSFTAGASAAMNMASCEGQTVST